MKQRASTSFFENKASKKLSSIQKMIEVKAQIDKHYNVKYLHDRKLCRKLSKRHKVQNCDRNEMKFEDSHGSSKNVYRGKEAYPHENKRSARNVNSNKQFFSNKELNYKCRRLSSKLTQHKRKVLFKSNNNPSALSLLHLCKTMTHSSKSVQSRKAKENLKVTFPEIDIKYYFSNRKSTTRDININKDETRPMNLRTERINPSMILYDHMPVCTAPQPQSATYGKTLLNTPKSEDNTIKKKYTMLPVRGRIELITEKEVSVDSHANKNFYPNLNRNNQGSKLSKHKTSVYLTPNKNNQFSKYYAEFGQHLSKFSIQQSNNNKLPRGLIANTAIHVDHNYAKENRNISILRHHTFLKNNNENEITKNPYFQTYHAFNVRLPQNPKKSIISFFRRRESKLNETGKCDSSKKVTKKRGRRSNDLKVIKIKVPKTNGSVSISNSSSLTKPKKATISSIKFKDYLKSRDNRHPSYNEITSESNPESLKNIRPNRHSLKQIALSQSVHGTKKKNKRVTCAKGGIKGIYIQYKGTWGRAMSKRRIATEHTDKGSKVKTKYSYTKPRILQNKTINTNVETKKKDKGTKFNTILYDVVPKKDQKFKINGFGSYTKNRNVYGYERYSPEKLTSEKSYPNIVKRKSSSIEDHNRRKSMLPYNSKLKMKAIPNRRNIKSTSTISRDTISNSKVPTKIQDPKNRNIITEKAVGYLKPVPNTRYRSKKTHEKHYGKTPILKKCFYALGIKRKVKSSDYIKENNKSYANNLRIDLNTKEEKYKKLKNREEPLRNNIKQKSISIDRITKHVSKTGLKNQPLMDKNRRNLSKIFRALHYTTTSPHRSQHGRIHRKKGKNSITLDHSNDYVHQHNKVNKKSISLSNNNFQVNPNRLKFNKSKIRSYVKRKQRDPNYANRNSSLQLDKYNNFRIIQSLIHTSKKKQCSNKTDLSKGDNTEFCKKNIPKRSNVKKEYHPEVYRSPSTSTGGSNLNSPLRVRKKHNIFGDNIGTESYKTKYMPSMSRTSQKPQEKRSTIRQCINKFGFKRPCDTKASSSSTKSKVSSNKNIKDKKSRPFVHSQIKDYTTSRKKEIPCDNKVTVVSMLKISIKTKNTGYKDQKPKYAISAVSITNVTPSKSKTNIRSENSDIKKKQKAKSCHIKAKIPRTNNKLPMTKTKKEIMKLSLNQKPRSRTGKASGISSRCRKNEVGDIKPIRGAIINDSCSSWCSKTNFAKSSLINILKKVVKPLFRQQPVLEKKEQDTSTNTLKLEIKKEITECPSKSAECQINNKNQTVKLQFKRKDAVEPPRYQASCDKSFTCFKNKISNLLSIKRKRSEKLGNVMKPNCQLKKSVTCDTESNIVPLLKNISRIKPPHKKPNAATKAALTEIQADDPTVPKSVKDPLLKLIVDKNTMNVLNRDDIVYGLGSRRNESGAVKQGCLALKNKLMKTPAVDLIINRDDARIIGADTKTTRGSRFKKDICNEKLCASNKGKKDSKCVSYMNSPGQSRKTKNLPCIYQCPECLKIRGQQTDRTKVFREPQTAGMVATEKVLDNISNVMLSWVGRSHYVCGITVCKKERAKIEQERKKQKVKIKPCTCGSYECETAMAKKYHKHKIKRGKRKYKALKQKRIEKLKERQRTHMENALAKEKSKLVTMDKADLQKQYTKEDAFVIKRRKKREKEALKRVETFKNANDLFLLTESVMDIGKLAICVVFNSVKSSIAAISNPKMTIRRLKVAAKDPQRALHRMSQSCKASEASAIIRRMHRRGRVMKTVIFFKNAMQSNPVTNYLLHIRDPRSV